MNLLTKIMFLSLMVIMGVGVCGEASAVSWSSMTNPLKNVWSSLYALEAKIVSSSKDFGCRGCSRNRITDPILTELRVEYVKQQILMKLRLAKPPDVSISLSTLPKPLINGNVLELRPGEPLEPDKPAESFYGKTDQVVVFPQEG